jgi:hypothetical protein
MKIGPDTLTLADSVDHTFDKVDIEASFPGGNAAWKKFLEKNLRGDVATENLIKQQKNQVQLEKSEKEYLLKQQEDQKYLERSKKEYLLKQQRERLQLEKPRIENKQKSNAKDSLSKLKS